MRAVIFGTGRVGCGFVGPALRTAGYELVHVGRNASVVAHLDRIGHYRVRLAEGGEADEVGIDVGRSLHCSEGEDVAREVSRADLVATAVGVEGLWGVASAISPGLARRSRPVNVLSFENLVDAGSRLRALVAERLPSNDASPRHGFAGALIHRVIARRLGDPGGAEPLVFVADRPDRFRVEADGLAHPLPPISGMALAEDYAACVRRKLYVFGAGHATAGYLGYLKGYRYVHSAVRDPEIRAVVLGAMTEGQRGIAARYGHDEADGCDDLGGILARFGNAALCDPVCRVGRDPCRKLAREDRLVGAAQLAEETGETADNLALAIAAALYFRCAGDRSAAELRAKVETLGVASTVEEVCGLDRDDALLGRVSEAWASLTEGRHPENFLLDLGRSAWAAERPRAGVGPAVGDPGGRWAAALEGAA